MKNGTGSWDGYITYLNDLKDNNAAKLVFTSGITSSLNLVEPACANNVMTVGSMNTKVEWKAIDGGIYRNAVQETLEGKSSFSSEGPTADRRIKPEIYAPGSWIMSSKSSTTQYDVYAIDPDNNHVIKQGTSMAAPFVTGALALLLQANPTWRYTDLYNRLKNTSNDKYGYQLLDIMSLLCKDNDNCKQNPYTPKTNLYDPKVYSDYKADCQEVK